MFYGFLPTLQHDQTEQFCRAPEPARVLSPGTSIIKSGLNRSPPVNRFAWSAASAVRPVITEPCEPNREVKPNRVKLIW